VEERSGDVDLINYVFYFLLGIVFVTLLLLSNGLKEHVEGDESSKPKLKDFVKVCPRCGSTDVKLDTEFFKGIVQYTGKLKYMCNRCGFIAYAFPEMTVEEAVEFEEKLGWKPDK
jgi:ribosomal protein S27AE